MSVQFNLSGGYLMHIVSFRLCYDSTQPTIFYIAYVIYTLFCRHGNYLVIEQVLSPLASGVVLWPR